MLLAMKQVNARTPRELLQTAGMGQTFGLQRSRHETFLLDLFFQAVAHIQ
jgi:hypothetical protein